VTSLKIFYPVAFLVATSFGCRSIPKEFIRVSGNPIALTHVRVIDGTGALPKEDQTIIIENSRIREIGETSRISLSGVAQTLDLAGYTVLPGLVGMHDHLFYALPPGSPSQEMLATFPKLYLASGVTSLRTAGTLNLDAEVKLKKEIDRSREIGPHLYLSSPYVDPNPNSAPNPKGWAEGVEQLVPLGINSVKVYTHARSSELSAVIQAAHRHGIRVTGHSARWALVKRPCSALITWSTALLWIRSFTRAGSRISVLIKTVSRQSSRRWMSAARRFKA